MCYNLVKILFHSVIANISIIVSYLDEHVDQDHYDVLFEFLDVKICFD